MKWKTFCLGMVLVVYGWTQLSCDSGVVLTDCLCPQERICQGTEPCVGGGECVTGCCGGCVECIGDGDCKVPGQCCRSYRCTTECEIGCEKCVTPTTCKAACSKCSPQGCCVSATCESELDCREESGPPKYCGFNPELGCRTCLYVRCDQQANACTDPGFPLYVKCEGDWLPTCADNGLCECRQPCGSACPTDPPQFCCKESSDPSQYYCKANPENHCPDTQCQRCTVLNANPGGTVNDKTCKWENANCSCVDLDPLPAAFAGMHLSMAIKPDGTPVFAGYYGQPYGDLIYGEATSAMTGASITWTFVDGVPGGAECVGSKSGPREGIKEPGVNVGWDTSIAVDSSGYPRISYYDVDNQDLKFAYLSSSGGWHTIPVESNGQTGRFTSLVLDSNNIPYIAYMTTKDDVGVSYMRVAKGNGSIPTSWTFYTVDMATVPSSTSTVEDWPKGVGLFAKIALYSDGTPAVAYYDNIQKKLKFAWWGPSSQQFFIEDVDVTDEKGQPLTNLGANVSLFIEKMGSVSSDVVHLAFQDVGKGDLYYVKFTGWAEWSKTRQLIDAGGRNSSGNVVTDPDLAEGPFHQVGNYASLVVDADHIVRVAYQDATSLDLVYAARGDAGTWVVTVEKRKKTGVSFDGAFGFFTNQVLERSGTFSWIAHFKHNLRTDPFGSQVEIIKKY